MICEITESSDGRYIVSWPNRGAITTIANIKLMYQFAFNTGDDQISFLSSNGDVITFDSIVFLQNNYERYIDERYIGLISIKFNTRAYADKFIYEIEKHITWKLLTRKDYD